MIETHIAFKDIPDVFPKPPEDTRPLRYFALGMALGFIVQRGDWYYFGLEKPSYAKDTSVRVLYEKQDWPTVYELSESSSSPSKIGRLDFTQRESDVDKARHQLAQGRENAIEELRKTEEYIDLLEGAVDEYHQGVGNEAFYHQLRAYCDEVLRPRASGKNIFSREREQIEKRLSKIGQ